MALPAKVNLLHAIGSEPFLNRGLFFLEKVKKLGKIFVVRLFLSFNHIGILLGDDSFAFSGLYSSLYLAGSIPILLVLFFLHNLLFSDNPLPLFFAHPFAQNLRQLFDYSVLPHASSVDDESDFDGSGPADSQLLDRIFRMHR